MYRLLLLLPLTLVCAAVFAAATHNETLDEAPADYRGSLASPLDGADSLDWSSPIAAGGAKRSLIPTKGNPKVYLRADLSVDGATVGVICGLWHKKGSTYTFLGVAGVSTLSATIQGKGTRASGRVLTTLTSFDTGPATHVEIRKSDPSDSATVTLYPFVGSSAPRGAGAD